jgi:hypothetical protein
LAEWDQDNQSEGFGESCTGSITFTGDNLKCVNDVMTTAGYYAKLKADESKSLDDFIKKFYPKELPKFTVVPGADRYYNVLLDGVLVHKQFAYPEKKPTEKIAEKWENFFNT